MKAIVTLLLLLTVNAHAQNAVEDLVPGYCSPMSKNPICGERAPHPRIPPRFCPVSKSCTVINAVVETTGRSAQARFTCSDSSGQEFDCSNLVDRYGKNIEGFIVLVTTKFFARSHPGCHVIGGCQKCIKLSSYAEINQQCQ